MRVLDAALRHAEHGRPVFPCDPRSKAPLTEHGFHDASLDPAAIRHWFDRRRPPMLAIPTGARTRLVVLDQDGDQAIESRRELERRHAPLPRTASVVTPSGGSHDYFAHPGVEIPNSVGGLGPGLDVRGDGGYVIVPPSVAVTGRRYEIDEEAPPAPLPAWLLGLVRQPANENGRAVPAAEWLRIVRDGLDDGERNQGLSRLTGHLLRRYVDVDLTAELVQLVNDRCRPPLPAGEVERIIDSIAGRELRRRLRAR
jgi:hypothetical protein